MLLLLPPPQCVQINTWPHASAPPSELLSCGCRRAKWRNVGLTRITLQCSCCVSFSFALLRSFSFCCTIERQACALAAPPFHHQHQCRPHAIWSHYKSNNSHTYKVPTHTLVGTNTNANTINCTHTCAHTHAHTHTRKSTQSLTRWRFYGHTTTRTRGAQALRMRWDALREPVTVQLLRWRNVCPAWTA